MEPSSNNDNYNYPEPKIRVSKAAYTVWILPLVALALAMWLIYKNFTNAGIQIYITFSDATGIVANKTAVRFRGIEVGRVRTLVPLEDGSGVLASVEMGKESEPYLTDKLKFWLVKPNIGISGVTGLETLLSGAYIQVDGGEEVKEGNASRYFEALVGEPPVDIAAGLLVYKLVTSDASGINKGAMVYHRNIPVGEVHDVQLSDDHQSVELVIAIEPKYKGLVKRGSRFWNITGVKASFDLSGVEIETSSVASMVIGGVAFSSPSKSGVADEQSLFRLYPSEESARDSLEVKLNFSADADVKVGTGIYYNQQKVGEVSALDWLADFSGLEGRAKLSLDMTRLMKADTQFWLDEPSLSMNNVNMGQLIQGTVVRITPGVNGSANEFTVLEQSPYKRWALSGLHFSLTTADAYGLSQGSAIYYKSQKIGSVQWVDFNPKTQLFTLDGLVYPRFTAMIKRNSQFYNLSGIDFDAKIQGVKLTVPSIAQLLSGGIGLYMPTEQSALLPSKSVLPLHKDLETAVAKTTMKRVDLYLRSNTLYAPEIDTPLFYQGFKIGKVSEVTLADDGSHTLLALTVKRQYRQLIRNNSTFYVQGALDIKAGLRGVKVEAGPLMAMIAGGISLRANEQDKLATIAAQGREFLLYPNKDAIETDAVYVQLQISRQTSLAVGADVKYRGFTVGQVSEVSLLADLSGVNARVKLNGQYGQHFSRQGAVYSLVQPHVSLNGVKNLTSALLGDSLVVSKGSGERQYQFVVTQQNLSQMAGLKVRLEAQQLGSVTRGDPLLYKQLRIGEVSAVGLTSDNKKVAVDLIVYPQYRHLVTQGSKFYNASGIKIDAGLFSGVKVDTQTLDSIMAGGIALVADLQGQPVDQQQVFELFPQAQPGWEDGVITSG